MKEAGQFAGEFLRRIEPRVEPFDRVWRPTARPTIRSVSAISAIVSLHSARRPLARCCGRRSAGRPDRFGQAGCNSLRKRDWTASKFVRNRSRAASRSGCCCESAVRYRPTASGRPRRAVTLTRRSLTFWASSRGQRQLGGPIVQTANEAAIGVNAQEPAGRQRGHEDGQQTDADEQFIADGPLGQHGRPPCRGLGMSLREFASREARGALGRGV